MILGGGIGTHGHPSVDGDSPAPHLGHVQPVGAGLYPFDSAQFGHDPCHIMTPHLGQVFVIMLISNPR